MNIEEHFCKKGEQLLTPCRVIEERENEESSISRQF